MPLFSPLPTIAPNECMNHRHVDLLTQMVLCSLSQDQRDALIESLNAQYLAWLHADLLDAPEVVERADVAERFLLIAQHVS